jgi:phospholipid/cholesterol/gamma-HCH transport system permease protein
MMLIRYLTQIGSYFLMLKEVFNKPTKWSVMRGLIFKEIDDLVIDSLGIVAFISFFVGGVVTIQTALNLTNPLIPYWICNTSIGNFRVCTYFHIYYHGRKNGVFHYF